MKTQKVLAVAFLIFGLGSWLYGQRQTGSIRGIVTDSEKTPLPGVAITVKGPSLIGSAAAVSTGTGAFRLPALPPGEYVLVAEISGFKTLKRDGLIVNVGAITEIQILMEQSTMETEVQVVADSPTVDVQNSKVVQIIADEVMQNLPGARNIAAAVNLVAGVVPAGGVGGITHGATQDVNAVFFDGVQANSPDSGMTFVNVNWEAVEEIEIGTAGQMAEVGGGATGAFVNVVTKSGGNKFSGGAQVYLTRAGFNQVLFTDNELRTLGVSKPTFNPSALNASLTLGGPILKDKIWFFLNGVTSPTTSTWAFRPTTINGRAYENPGDYKTSAYLPFLKLTYQMSKSLRLTTMFNANLSNSSVRYNSWNIVPESQTSYEAQRLMGNILLSWIVSPTAYIDVRASLNNLKELAYGREEVKNSPTYSDWYTGYQWGAADRQGDDEWNINNYQLSVQGTKFADALLGGNHEFKAGIDISLGSMRWDYWRKNPLSYTVWNGSVYYFGYGAGLVQLYTSGVNKGDVYSESIVKKWSGFLQDSWNIKNRLTINLGVRMDYQQGSKPGRVKKAGSAFAVSIGETAVEPRFGFNPFGERTAEDWTSIITFKTISPRVGISYDLFGDGKTALKLSYGRYFQPIAMNWYNGSDPFAPYNFNFYWVDRNLNGAADAAPTDFYYLIYPSPLSLLPEYQESSFLPGTKAPSYDEVGLTLDHELVKDFSVGISYFYKNKLNQIDDGVYDPVTKKKWNKAEDAPEWWIPMTTTVPAVNGFPESTVTVYYLSNNAPALFYAQGNVPDAKRTYNGLELRFNKRFSRGWQLGGSVVYSKTVGNINGGHLDQMGWSGAFDNPNYFINRTGRDAYDKPLMIKLYGTYVLPFDFLLSFNYTHLDGAPWGRSVTVYAPGEWAATNNVRTDLSYTVMLEAPGTRRNTPIDNMDLRLEKRFGLGKYGRIGIFLDVFNVFGYSKVNVGLDPGGTWQPSGNNSSSGIYAPASTFGRNINVEGVRSIRLSFHYEF